MAWQCQQGTEDHAAKANDTSLLLQRVDENRNTGKVKNDMRTSLVEEANN